MPQRIRYCQRKACGRAQVLWDDDDARPCAKCGGSNFGAQPPTHATSGRSFYELSDADRVFLRVQGIDPEED